MLDLPGLAPIALTADLVQHLEVALREYRRNGLGSREYAGEIAAFLAEHPEASTIEIARGIRARDERVLSVLNDDPAFENLPATGNREGRAARWRIATSPGEVVPKPRTSRHEGGSTA